jgi:DNA-binding MarR family transcriptional regulator
MSTLPPRLGFDEPLAKAIALTERDVDDARRLLKLLSADRPAVENASHGADSKALAATLLRLRASRLRYFPAAMFGEPAWDMMLAIHAQSDGERPTIALLADRLRLPVSSAARWGRYLEVHGLVARHPHPNDARAHLMELTQKGQGQLEAYIAFRFKEP